MFQNIQTLPLSSGRRRRCTAAVAAPLEGPRGSPTSAGRISRTVGRTCYLRITFLRTHIEQSSAELTGHVLVFGKLQHRIQENANKYPVEFFLRGKGCQVL